MPASIGIADSLANCCTSIYIQPRVGAIAEAIDEAIDPSLIRHDPPLILIELAYRRQMKIKPESTSQYLCISVCKCTFQLANLANLVNLVNLATNPSRASNPEPAIWHSGKAKLLLHKLAFLTILPASDRHALGLALLCGSLRSRRLCHSFAADPSFQTHKTILPPPYPE
jgi:hypothetical protein